MVEISTFRHFDISKCLLDGYAEAKTSPKVKSNELEEEEEGV